MKKSKHILINKRKRYRREINPYEICNIINKFNAIPR